MLKVGDTVPDIQAGRNAGVRTIGITRTGSEVGLPLEDWEQLEPDSKHAALEQAEQVLRQAGANDVLESISELPDWLDQHTA